MLTNAVLAGIPLVYVETNDRVHILDTLSGLFPDYRICMYTSGEGEDTLDDVLYYAIDTTLKSYTDAYKDAEEKQYTVIFVNGDIYPEMLDCGELLPCVDMVREFLELNIPTAVAKKSTSFLKGLTYSDLKKVIRFCPVYHETITAQALQETKVFLDPKQVGIVPVDVATDFFFDLPKELQSWIETNKDYLFCNVDARLVPKGILLHGESGCGKSEVSRHISREWKIPLYLLDINSMLTKWQGEAETHLNTALDTLDNESQCIVLFDEVEKLFSTDSKNDTGQRLLSRILWWLQTKKSKVFVVMTCNDKSSIPPELYRSGRISRVFELKGITSTQVKSFIEQLLMSFNITDKEVLKNILKSLGTLKSQKCIPHAELNQKVIDFLQTSKHGLENTPHE